jgi:Tol biopolymer transport system component
MRDSKRAGILAFLLALLLVPGVALADKGGQGKGKPPKGEEPPPPPNPAIAYVSKTKAGHALMLMNTDGSNKQVVLAAQEGVEYRAPNWSPDGTQLVFARHSDTDGSGIHVVNLDGSGLRQVVAIQVDYAGDPAWSPLPLGDGDYYIAFTDWSEERGSLDLFAVRLDGQNRVNLTTDDPPKWIGCCPTWDPLATRLAASVFYGHATLGTDIQIYDLHFDDQGKLYISSRTNITDRGPLANYEPQSHLDWAKTADNKIVVGAYDPSGNDYADLWVLDIEDPYNPFQLTDIPRVAEIMPTWSLDDSQVVFWQQHSMKGRWSLYIVDADGSGYRDIGSAKAGEVQRYPDWRRCWRPEDAEERPASAPLCMF